MTIPADAFITEPMELCPAPKPIETGSIHVERDVGHDDLEHLQNVIDSPAVETVHSIHGFMRDKTALEAGTTVDNRNGLWAMFVEDVAPEDIPYYGGAMRYAKRYAEMEKNTGGRGQRPRTPCLSGL